MVLSCPKCEARLQLDDAKAPSRPFTVRCPKCQGAINVQPSTTPEDTLSEAVPLAHTSSSPDRVAFERSVPAPLFRPIVEESIPAASGAGSPSGLNDVAKLLAEALRQADTGSGPSRGRKRPAWDRRNVLVCASPAYREAVARLLTNHDYEVFVADNMAQALGRMREERM